MYKLLGKLMVILLLGMGLSGGSELFAKEQKIYCSVCKKKLKRNFLRSSDNKFFCDKKCFETTRPRCSQCKRSIDGKYFRADNKPYCSQDCVERASMIKCMRCGKAVNKGSFIESAYGKFLTCLPCGKIRGCVVCHRAHRKMRQMPNRCYICRDCDHNIVDDLRELQQVLEQVRSTLQRKLRFTFDHPIYLEMRSFGRDPSEPFDGRQEMGLYIYNGRMSVTKVLPGEYWHDKKAEVKITDEKCVIVIMDSLPKFKACEIMAHELAHDYMRHRWPYIKDLKYCEGFAELVAAEYNRLSGYGKWNYRMEMNPDKVYGDGYRMFKAWLQQGSWRNVFKQLDIANDKAKPAELK